MKKPRKSKLLIYVRCFVIAILLIFVLFSCVTIKKNELNKVISCNKIDSSFCAGTIVDLLHDSEFLYSQRENALSCYVKLMNRLSDSVEYNTHYICDFTGCSYSSIWVNDSQSYIFRYDLRNIMNKYKYIDTMKYINKYYKKFQLYDSIMIDKYVQLYHLKRNLDPIFIDD